MDATQYAINTPDQLMTAAQVMTRLNICRSTLYGWIREGALPPPLKFGKRASRWRASEIASVVAGTYGR